MAELVINLLKIILFYDNTMKNKKTLIIILITAVLGLSSVQIVHAAYYGIYDIREVEENVYGPETYPDLVHFDWVNRTYTYNSSGDTFSITVNLYAPNNWDTPSSQDGIDYDEYKKEDYTYGSTQWEGGSETFDDVYSYFYQIENQSSTIISDITIPYDPATVVGYGSAADELTTDISNMTVANDQITATFDGGLSAGATSDWFFMTSENWWGWQPLTYNGDTAATGSTYLSHLYNSPDGMIPAPNPEAPTVALYIIGLLGMGGFYYNRKRRIEKGI